MGRWGFCKYRIEQIKRSHRLPRGCDTLTNTLPSKGLFEGDQDLDLLSDINYDVFGDNLQPDENIKPTNSNLPAEDNDEVGGDRNDLLYADAALCRAKFDSGLGEKLFAQYRAKKNEYLGPYKVIVLGALMIHVGAKISDENLQYLHDLVPEINCNEGHAMPLWDEGFRGPGKRQFLAALAAYKAGVPRNLQTAR